MTAQPSCSCLLLPLQLQLQVRVTPAAALHLCTRLIFKPSSAKVNLPIFVCLHLLLLLRLLQEVSFEYPIQRV